MGLAERKKSAEKFTEKATGTLFALTIPASPADHDTFLTTLILGKSGTSQTLVLDASGYQRLIIPQRLIAGQACDRF